MALPYLIIDGMQKKETSLFNSVFLSHRWPCGLFYCFFTLMPPPINVSRRPICLFHLNYLLFCLEHGIQDLIFDDSIVCKWPFLEVMLYANFELMVQYVTDYPSFILVGLWLPIIYFQSPSFIYCRNIRNSFMHFIETLVDYNDFYSKTNPFLLYQSSSMFFIFVFRE